MILLGPNGDSDAEPVSANIVFHHYQLLFVNFYLSTEINLDFNLSSDIY